MTSTVPSDIKVIFFDFSGVLAEEGFVEGLLKTGEQNGLNPEEFLSTVVEICFGNGYATGEADEKSFWQDVRDATGITMSDEELRHAILSHFVIRLWMLDAVDHVKQAGFTTAILSDHTNWLEELDEAHGIYKHFDRIFNSYREGMTKRSHDYFRHACAEMNIAPHEALFIDDNPKNTQRANEVGLHTITYTSYPQFVADMQKKAPNLMLPAEL